MRAADAWSEAGEAMAVLGETATAVEYLRPALDSTPPTSVRSTACSSWSEPGYPAAAVEILEAGLAELAKRPSADLACRGHVAGERRRERCTPRRAPPSRRRVVQRPPRAYSTAPSTTTSRRGSSSRSAPRRSTPRAGCTSRSATTRWSRSSSRPSSTCSATRSSAAPGRAPPPARASWRCASATSSSPAVTSRRPTRLAPSSLENAETLAEIYSMPGFRDGDERAPWRHRASELFVAIGSAAADHDDDHTAISTCAAPSGVDPYSAPSSKCSRRRSAETSQWDELDRILRHRAQMATESGAALRPMRRRRRALPQPAAAFRAGSDPVPDRARRLRAAARQSGQRATRAAPRGPGLGGAVAADGSRAQPARRQPRRCRARSSRSCSSSRRSRASTWAIATGAELLHQALA